MAYKQVRKANPNVPGRSGWCLNYARNVFGVGPKYPWAWSAWNGAKYKHKTRTLPNVAVPLWFSYHVYQGHVAVYVPGKGIYSTTNRGVLAFKSIGALEKYISGCKYVGWTEDINGVRVVVPTSTSVKQYYRVRLGDTVTKICKKFNISIARFKTLNPQIKNYNLIFPGQKVRVK